MRRNPTEPEKRLWRVLSNAQLGGFKLRRQMVIGRYIADFVCAQKALIVEVDGDTHVDPADEARRDAALAGFGYTVLHVTNSDVMANIDGVREQLLTTLQTLSDARTPHPNPSPEGEGLEAAEAGKLLGISLEGILG
jgi:very-short-patch-repair endonuclease